MVKNRQLFVGFGLGMYTWITVHLLLKIENWTGYIFIIQTCMFLIPIFYRWYINFTHKEKSMVLFRALVVLVASTSLCESVYLYNTINRIGGIVAMATVVLNFMSLVAGDSIILKQEKEKQSV